MYVHLVSDHFPVLAMCRNKLRSFLEFTAYYSQPPLLARLKETDFHFETAIVYGKVRAMLCACEGEGYVVCVCGGEGYVVCVWR